MNTEWRVGFACGWGASLMPLRHWYLVEKNHE